MTSIKAIISGGGGFLGRYLCRTLLRRKHLGGKPLESIAVLDTSTDAPPQSGSRQVPSTAPLPDSPILERHTGDVTDKPLLLRLLRPDNPDQQLAVFHLASVMSAQGELHFDHCLNINLHGTLTLLEACRQIGQEAGQVVRFVFPSSFIAFGPQREVHDESRLMPHSTYGMSKALGELLVSDYTRKGFIDGRTGRLPTVIVRPGSANGAATGCFSGIVRELLMGNCFEIPVDSQQEHPVQSVQKSVKGLIALAECPSEALGDDRSINLPTLPATLDDLLFHTQQIAMARGIPLGEVRRKVDPQINKLVVSMPQVMHAPRAKQLGLPQDRDLEDIVQAYATEFLAAEMDETHYPLLRQQL